MKKRQWQGQIIAELLNNYREIKPRCRHFLDCGGCSLQDFAYEDQLKVKREKVIGLYNDQLSITNNQNSIDKIKIFGKEEYGYRTRMDYVVNNEGYGLRRKRKFDEVVDLQECYLIDSEIWQFLRSVYNEGLKLGLVPYDLKTHEGDWRYLSVRINEKNDLMLILVTKRGVDERIEKMVARISGIPAQGGDDGIVVKSIYHLVNDGLGDSNFGETRKYWGEKSLVFGVNDLKYNIEPNTFFQNNLELLNDLIKKLVGYIDKDDQVLDLYCGVGTLSLPVAQKCKQVLGVELLEESIDMAKENAILNKIDNVEFMAEDVDDYLISQKSSAQADKSQKINTLVLDPPRKGLEKSAEVLLEYDFEKIVYMSCNPLSLMRDLVILTEKYEIEEFTLWDLYPQTPHVEALVLLNRPRSA